jgi:hypothetical protein
VDERLANTITYADIIADIDDAQERAITQAAFDQYGITSSTSAGATSGKLAIEAKIWTPVFGYGLNSIWSVGVAVPIINYSIRYQSQFTDAQSLADLKNQLIQDGNPGAAEKIEDRTSQALEQQLEKYHYLPLDQQGSSVSDPLWWSRVQLLSTSDWKLLSTQSLSIPLFKNAQEDELVSFGLQDEQWDLGAGLNLSYSVNEYLLLGASLGHTVQLEGSTTRRIPYPEKNNTLSGRKEKIRFNPGDITRTEISLTIEPSDSYSFYAAYQWQYKSEDKYSGKDFSQASYDKLSEETSQGLQTLLVGAEGNTINAFLAKDFLLPMSYALNYSRPLYGKNVPISEMITAQLGFYYE